MALAMFPMLMQPCGLVATMLEGRVLVVHGGITAETSSELSPKLREASTRHLGKEHCRC